MAILMIVGSKSADYEPVSGELANISHFCFRAKGRDVTLTQVLVIFSYILYHLMAYHLVTLEDYFLQDK